MSNMDDDTIKFPGGEPPDNNDENRPPATPDDAQMISRERMRIQREEAQERERQHQELLAAQETTNEYLEDIKEAFEQGKREFRPRPDSTYTVDVEDEARRRGWVRAPEPAMAGRDVPAPPNTGDVPGMTDRAAENLDVVVALTATLRDNIGEMTNMLGRHVELLDNMATGTDTINKKRETGVNLTRAETAELVEQDKWHRARSEAQEQINDALKDERSLRAEMLDLDIYHEGKYRIGRDTIDDRELMRRFRARDTDPDQFRGIEEALVNLRAEENARGERGNTFDPSQVFRALQRGDFMGALGEAAQRVPGSFTEGLARRSELRGAQWVGAGAARGGMAGAAMGAAGRFLPVAAGAAMSPAAIFLGAREIMQQFNSRADYGAAGGLDRTEGFMESLRATRQAFTQSLNPFDALSRRDAAQVGRGIREAGFTGDVADAWQDAIGDVIIDTGMRGEAALAAFNTAAKELGLSANEFRLQMRDVDDVAKSSSKSVSEIVSSMEEMQKLAATTGGRTAVAEAGRIEQLLTPVLSRPGMAPAQFGAANFAQSPEQRAQLGMRVGLSYAQTQSDEYFTAIPKIMDNLADYFNSLFPGQPPEIVAERVVATGLAGQLLPGMNALAIQQLIERAGNAPGSFSVQRGVERQRKLLPGRKARGAEFEAERAAERAGEKERSIEFLGLKGRSLKSSLQDMGKRFGFLDDTDEDQVERRAYTNTIARSLMDQNVPVKQRREILRPLWNADNDEEFDKAKKGLARRIEKQTTEVIIKMHPNTKGILENPQTAAINSQYLEGRGSSYGGRRPRISP